MVQNYTRTVKNLILRNRDLSEGHARGSPHKLEKHPQTVIKVILAEQLEDL